MCDDGKRYNCVVCVNSYIASGTMRSAQRLKRRESASPARLHLSLITIFLRSLPAIVIVGRVSRVPLLTQQGYALLALTSHTVNSLIMKGAEPLPPLS